MISLLFKYLLNSLTDKIINALSCYPSPRFKFVSSILSYSNLKNTKLINFSFKYFLIGKSIYLFDFPNGITSITSFVKIRALLSLISKIYHSKSSFKKSSKVNSLQIIFFINIFVKFIHKTS